MTRKPFSSLTETDAEPALDGFRPRLLVEAARAGIAAGLARGRLREPQNAARLAAEERACEALRRARSPAWRPSRHVALLIAVMASAAAPRGEDVPAPAPVQS